MKKTLLLCTICAFLFAACTTPGKRTAIGAASGAAIGAAAGAVISHTTGGKSGTGALIGGLTGLAAGGALGNYYDKQAKELAAIADVVKGDNGIQVFLKNDILFDSKIVNGINRCLGVGCLDNNIFIIQIITETVPVGSVLPTAQDQTFSFQHFSFLIKSILYTLLSSPCTSFMVFQKEYPYFSYSPFSPVEI